VLLKLGLETTQVKYKCSFVCISKIHSETNLIVFMILKVFLPVLNCVYSLFPRLSAFNVAWTDLSVAALNTLCTELPSSIHRINISGCRKTLNDNRMYFLTFSYLLHATE
jgi:hypothetical protein